MRVRISGRWVWVGLVGLGLVASTACGKKSSAEKALSAAKAVSESMVPSNVQNDYMKPYLTDEKMVKFIESLQEDVNPFEVLFKQGAGGRMIQMTEIQKRAEEFSGFARKYGFADFSDYTAVWGRIMVGEMLVAAEDMKKSTIEMWEKSIQSAEESLKKPDLDAETRKLYEDQIAGGKTSIEDLKKPDTSSLNEADLALVAKYKTQIDEATKKYKQNQGN